MYPQKIISNQKCLTLGNRNFQSVSFISYSKYMAMLLLFKLLCFQFGFFFYTTLLTTKTEAVRVSSAQHEQESMKQNHLKGRHDQQTPIPYPNPMCLTNEVWEDCGSSTCWENTCADLLYPAIGSKPCTKDCRQGMCV
jgi:hypothetical protein